MTLLTVIETLQEVLEIYGDLEIKGIKDGELFDKVKINCFDDDPTLYIELYHK